MEGKSFPEISCRVDLSPKRLNCNIAIAIHCCNFLRLCPRAPCLNIKLPTYIPHPSIASPQRIGTPGFKRGPGSSEPEGHLLHTYLHWKAVIAMHLDTVCFVFAHPAKTKEKFKNKQAVVNGQWLTPPILYLRISICACTSPSERPQGMA
ncbi:hypothetical protein PEX1_085350 [Penicillium expansum]|uniref:Uncharacterized protein n=1 Tax=Penicillium expansum TaxID=27334 RepID=A0A0A2JBM6_PENEN|nr:hypothetical protein PEX2_094570 [Penicillium expansum]KGO41376.1 hypothetical protein PEXP_104520 [Penicillium expansum]KGO50991.1 hypothetical protein PEX2_094570 [Penicillium expansum]KGO52764.1 hypothetical protein PEX1_085350 [Penicillium expansum]